MAESRWWVSNVIIYILFKKEWFFYVRLSLKQDEYHIYVAHSHNNLFKLNTKKINTQIIWNNLIRKPGINELFIAKPN